MRKLIGLFKGGYVAKAFALFSGGIFGQAIPFFLTPLLASYYSRAQFSELGIYITFITIISMIATLRLEHAFLIPDDELEVEELVTISLGSLVIITTITTVTSLLFNIPLLYNLLGMGAFLYGFSQIGIQLLNKLNENKKLVIHKSLIGPTAVLSQIMLKSSTMGLIFGKLIGDLISILPLISVMLKKSIKQISIHKIKELLIRYKNFPTINVLHGILSLLASKSPVLVFGYMGLANASGEFEMVTRIGLAPLTLIASSLYLAFSQKFAELEKNNSNVRAFLIKNIKGTLLLIILPLSIACLMAPYIIPLVLGSEWSKTGFYFLYMFPAYSAILLTSPYVYIPQYYFKQHLGLVGSFIISIIQITCLLSGLYFSVDLGVILFSFGTAIGNLGYLWFVFSLLPRYKDSEEIK